MQITSPETFYFIMLMTGLLASFCAAFLIAVISYASYWKIRGKSFWGAVKFAYNEL